MFNLKTIVTTIIGTSIVGTVVALPVKANEANLVRARDAELILSQIDDRNIPYDNETDDGLKNMIGLTGLALGTGVVGYYVRKAYKPSFVNLLPGINNSSNVTLLARTSPKLRRELLRLVHNQQTVNRLMNSTSNSHPGRSANWIAEKVIYDLKRDR
ncbi:hypothetical protein C7B62_08895 [Pleurocapsa sp. CCALA 161]|uniref:hypothetical protein n=1 Tax=Pleurocapsa sp. CCALA 161 TaxID=2107688 RepID=UPI000D0558EC|nr:hypothetical protein [Pleurocapsa sp. CCALA 161]PSB10577.1 hypothetical protein C7B62_08895 [Pleurocapsa sp. CCALA 161]